jgi:hypothetical protein
MQDFISPSEPTTIFVELNELETTSFEELESLL